eukprot:gene34005-62851_t
MCCACPVRGPQLPPNRVGGEVPHTLGGEQWAGALPAGHAVWVIAQVTARVAAMKGDFPYGESGSAARRQHEAVGKARPSEKRGRWKSEAVGKARPSEKRGRRSCKMGKTGLARAQVAQCVLALLRHFNTLGPFPAANQTWRGLRDAGAVAPSDGPRPNREAVMKQMGEAMHPADPDS